MSLRFPSRVGACMAVGLMALASLPGLAQKKALRICADPDNLPYSHQNRSGFDNKIGALLAREMGRRPAFVWARARRGFVREEFNRGACDVMMGVPSGMRGLLTTEPYYRSTYVFVTRRQDHLHIASFSDPQLNAKRIGLQVMEEDLSPPSLPLVRSGHAAQLVGYGSFGKEAGEVVRAVAEKRVGLAVVWGPLAGYYNQRQRLALELEPVSPPVDAGVPMVFDMTIGVHRGDTALRAQLSRAIEREKGAIDHILSEYGVPLLPMAPGGVS